MTPSKRITTATGQRIEFAPRSAYAAAINSSFCEDHPMVVEQALKSSMVSEGPIDSGIGRRWFAGGRSVVDEPTPMMKVEESDTVQAELEPPPEPPIPGDNVKGLLWP